MNYPDTDWTNSRSKAGPLHHSSTFLRGAQEGFLTQHRHVTEGMRFQGTQSANTLDLVFTNDEGNVTIDIEAPLGRSDHTVIYFSALCNSAKQCKPRYAPNQRDLNRGDYSKASFLLKKVSWDIIDSKNVAEAWTYFKMMLEDISNKTIPMKRANKRRACL